MPDFFNKGTDEPSLGGLNVHEAQLVCYRGNADKHDGRLCSVKGAIGALLWSIS